MMDRDLIQLRQCMHCLQQCDWYKGRMSKRRAKELLRRCRPGSFLLRDSDNPQYSQLQQIQSNYSILILYVKTSFLLQLFVSYLFSLSQNLHFVGPIATRIFFQDGLFWFDDGRQRFGNASAAGNVHAAGNSSRGTGSTESCLKTNKI